jgi:RNA polymerase sigma-70 factor (ECF subfamily)
VLSTNSERHTTGRRIVSSGPSQIWRTASESAPNISERVAGLAAGSSSLAEKRQRIVKLYDELRLPLHAYLACLGMSVDQAEDIVQESFLRLVRSRFSGDGEDHLRGWIFRVAHNLSMDIHRYQKRWAWTSDDEPVAQERQQPGDVAPSPEQQVLSDERMRHFESAFARLTPKQRQCVMLRAEGLRYREIAGILGVSVQRVGELMQRCITLLGANS